MQSLNIAVYLQNGEFESIQVPSVALIRIDYLMLRNTDSTPFTGDFVVTLNNRNRFLLYVACEIQVGKGSLLTSVAQEATLTEARLPSNCKVSRLRGQELGELRCVCFCSGAWLSTLHWLKQVLQ